MHSGFAEDMHSSRDTVDDVVERARRAGFELAVASDLFVHREQAQLAPTMTQRCGGVSSSGTGRLSNPSWPSGPTTRSCCSTSARSRLDADGDSRAAAGLPAAKPGGLGARRLDHPQAACGAIACRALSSSWASPKRRRHSRVHRGAGGRPGRHHVSSKPRGAVVSVCHFEGPETLALNSTRHGSERLSGKVLVGWAPPTISQERWWAVPTLQLENRPFRIASDPVRPRPAAPSRYLVGPTSPLASRIRSINTHRDKYFVRSGEFLRSMWHNGPERASWPAAERPRR